MYVYCTDYILKNMGFFKKRLLDILMQFFIMLRHLVAEISRFKFDDYCVIRTGASDLKRFWPVYIHRQNKLFYYVDIDLVIPYVK